jgi:hypothetical protein
MCVRSALTVVFERNAVACVAEEVRQLRELAKDRRAASLASFLRGKRPPSPRPTKSPRDRTRLAA